MLTITPSVDHDCARIRRIALSPALTRHPNAIGFHLPHERVIKIVVQRRRLWRKSVAALLSLAVPGSGQMYKGRAVSALAWAVLVVSAYVMSTPAGVAAHLTCVVAAAAGNNMKTRRRTYSAAPRF
jgi:hypothetical protein